MVPRGRGLFNPREGLYFNVKLMLLARGFQGGMTPNHEAVAAFPFSSTDLPNPAQLGPPCAERGASPWHFEGALKGLIGSLKQVAHFRCVKLGSPVPIVHPHLMSFCRLGCRRALAYFFIKLYMLKAQSLTHMKMIF